MCERNYIDSYTGKIERTDLYLCKVTMKNGTVFENLEPRRLFPHTNPNMYITLVDKDEKEICFVRDLKEIDESSAKALTDCFAEYYRIPYITAIRAVDDNFGALYWSVDTNYGPIRFRIRRHTDIKLVNGGRVLVRDANDNRYVIPDWTLLDSSSRKKIFSYL